MGRAGIYLIRHAEGSYVGKATDLARRRAGHFWNTRSKYYGMADECEFEVLENYEPLPNPVIHGEPLFTAQEVRSRLDRWLAEREAFWFREIGPTDNKQTPRSP